MNEDVWIWSSMVQPMNNVTMELGLGGGWGW